MSTNFKAPPHPPGHPWRQIGVKPRSTINVDLGQGYVATLVRPTPFGLGWIGITKDAQETQYSYENKVGFLKKLPLTPTPEQLAALEAVVEPIFAAVAKPLVRKAELPKPPGSGSKPL